MWNRMQRPRQVEVLVLTIFLGVSPIAGADMFIYPNKGQSQKQQEQDKFACHEWAVQQSGFDPANPQMAQTAPPPVMHSAGGGVLRGGARGAAIGAVGGAIAGDAGSGQSS